MKKNVFLILGVIMIVACSLIANFSDIGNDIPALAGSGFGLGLMIMGIWGKSEKKDGWTIASIILASIGGLFCAFAGLSQEKMTAIITAIIAAVFIVLSVFIPKIGKRE